MFLWDLIVADCLLKHGAYPQPVRSQKHDNIIRAEAYVWAYKDQNIGWEYIFTQVRNPETGEHLDVLNTLRILMPFASLPGRPRLETKVFKELLRDVHEKQQQTIYSNYTHPPSPSSFHHHTTTTTTTHQNKNSAPSQLPREDAKGASSTPPPNQGYTVDITKL